MLRHVRMTHPVLVSERPSHDQQDRGTDRTYYDGPASLNAGQLLAPGIPPR